MSGAARPGRAASPGGRIGLVSDTHGLLRPSVLTFLEGCKLIVHGGDIGGSAVLHELARLAPLIAVRGNNDAAADSAHLRERELVDVEDVRLFVIHDRSHIDADLHAMGVRVVVYGHSHRPSMEEIDGILYVNPGSAGPRRFKLPIAAGELQVSGRSVKARIVDFDE